MIFIILLFIGFNPLIAQPSMDKYHTSILIDWKTDTTKSFLFLQDSLEYGFMGFYESGNFNYKSIKDFINDSLNCPADSAGRLVTKIIMGFKPIYFCDSIKPLSKYHSNPTVGVYHTTETGGIILTGSMIEYYSNSAYINSDTDFILIIVMRNKFTKEYKVLAVRDRNGPQSYHLNIKIDSFNFNRIPNISYFDFIDVNSEFYPTKIVNEFNYKTIFNISNHKISQAKIEEIFLK